eukprot:TRINITY_DN14024_c0_g1_i1.p1 TRINITY_DN14024_c0_g1~~TRINITY_DN14024_c0_g1_i1.p1  ORF type:complete len:495 (-),score=95.35 TRINITY_DN14024_c0_g1_i1:26-1510(-)
MEQLNELVSFLGDDKEKVRQIALQNVQGYTSSKGGRNALKKTNVIEMLIRILSDSNASLRATALVSLVNLCEDDDLTKQILQMNIVPLLILQVIVLPNPLMELHFLLLINLTRSPVGAAQTLITAPGGVLYLVKLLEMALKEKEILNWESEHAAKNSPTQKSSGSEEKKDTDKFGWLAKIFWNVSQIKEGRKFFRKFVLQRDYILSNLVKTNLVHWNTIRRVGMIGLLRNVAFDLNQTGESDDAASVREKILQCTLSRLLVDNFVAKLRESEVSDVEWVQKHLLPLQQATEEVEEKEEAVPITNEEVCLIMETLFIMCASRKGRDQLRSCAVYYVAREFHNKFNADNVGQTEEEKEAGDYSSEKVSESICQLVDVLLRDEAPAEHPEPDSSSSQPNTESTSEERKETKEVDEEKPKGESEDKSGDTNEGDEEQDEEGDTFPCDRRGCLNFELFPKEFKHCASCKKVKKGVRYCSVACQRKDWDLGHKLVCGKPL